MSRMYDRPAWMQYEVGGKHRVGYMLCEIAADGSGYLPVGWRCIKSMAGMWDLWPPHRMHGQVDTEEHKRLEDALQAGLDRYREHQDTN